MSYILDALRKAERDRQVSRVPTLATAHGGAELLRRLELPPVDLVPMDAPGETAYRAALQAGDTLDWRPLMRVWQQRFEQFSEPAL